MSVRVLVADPIARDGVAILQQHAQVDVKTGLPPDELRAIIGEYDGLIVRSQTQVTRDIIEAAGKMRIIGRAGVGVDNIDLPAATERGIVVVNAPTGNTVSAAELAVALLMALARNIPAADASLRGGAWDRKTFTGVEVRNKVAGVVGLGQVGAGVARRLRGLEMRVLGFDPFVPDERARQLGVELVDLETLLRQADFLTLHTTLTPDTEKLINRERLATMKPDARIVNTARGGLIDEEALLEALNDGRIAGAALDVYSSEPAVGNPLTQHPRVIGTPHLGASTTEAQERVAVDVAKEMVAVLNGQPATAAVNAPFIDPETLERVGPYLAVAEMCGRLATQVAAGQWESIALEYRGDLADYDVTPLKAAAVAGLLSTISEEQVNLVSVNNIIDNRGWDVVERKEREAGAYANLVTVRLRTSDAETCVSGTLVHGEPHVVELNGFTVDVGRGGRRGERAWVLLLENEDRPGRVGAVGMELGAMGVNISHMDVGRGDAGDAIMVLAVDRELSPDEIHRLDAIPGIERVTLASL